MQRVKDLAQRAKWPLFWMSLGLCLLGAYAVVAHLYIDHVNLHTMTRWAQSADREIAALKKAAKPVELPVAKAGQ
jgi:formate-dependent nitrite reductase membrane component NrfD